jgi:hypothetical protein
MIDVQTVYLEVNAEKVIQMLILFVLIVQNQSGSHRR